MPRYRKLEGKQKLIDMTTVNKTTMEEMEEHFFQWNAYMQILWSISAVSSIWFPSPSRDATDMFKNQGFGRRKPVNEPIGVENP